MGLSAFTSFTFHLYFTWKTSSRFELFIILRKNNVNQDDVYGSPKCLILNNKRMFIFHQNLKHLLSQWRGFILCLLFFVASYFIFHDSDFLSHPLANLANDVRVSVQSVAQPLLASVRSEKEHWLVRLSLKYHPQEAVLINQCTKLSFYFVLCWVTAQKLN